MTDLGAGVHETPDQRDEYFAGATAPEGNGPTCPRCGHHDRVAVVNHPAGQFFCTCGSLFTGSDDEWRRLATYRMQAIERRRRGDQREAS